MERTSLKEMLDANPNEVRRKQTRNFQFGTASLYAAFLSAQPRPKHVDTADLISVDVTDQAAVSASCQSGLLLTRGAALRPAGRLGRRIMSVVLPTLLFLGLYLGQSTQAQKGNLPRPRITALPGSVVPSKEPVTILCEGPGHAEAYRISKVGVPEPADRDRQIMPRRTNTLNTTEMTPGFAGLYQCSYQTGGHWSPWSDPLQLVMTGAYEKPSLSSMVGPVVALGEKVKLQCFSNIKFDVFILTGEDGVHSTQNRSSGLLDKGHWAVFPLNRVSSTQAGTYRCYGAFNGDPYVWSFPSDQLQLQVKALPHSPSFEGKRLGLLIGAPVVAGVLILVLLLFLCCRCKAKNDAARKEGQPEAAGPADGQVKMLPSAQLGFHLQPLLEQLHQDELSKFKALLRTLSLKDEFQHISPTEVEEADGKQLAEILTNRCPSCWVETVTIQVFGKMNRTDLSERAKDELRAYCPLSSMGRNGLQESQDHGGCCSFVRLSVQQLPAAAFCALEAEDEEEEEEEEDESSPSWDIGDVQQLLSGEERLKSPALTQVGCFLFGLPGEKGAKALETVFGCQVSTEVKRELLKCRSVSDGNKACSSTADTKEVLYCLYESQDEQLVKEAVAQVKEISIHLTSTSEMMQSSFCLKRCQNLEKVSLQVDKGIFLENDTALKPDTQVERLASCPATTERWADLSSCLRISQSLTCLNLTANELPGEAAKGLCRTLSHPKCFLQRLSLENCHLTEANCKELSSALIVSQRLTHLCLAKNALGDRGVKLLCEGLSYPECQLQTLVLWGCAISPFCCADLSSALQRNRNLITLDLGQNFLGYSGIKMLCDALKLQSCPLRTVRLKIDESVFRIRKLLEEIKESNPQLTIESDHQGPKHSRPSSRDFIF
ncbi:hypothetical protein CB1_001271004 [Camelus ferus]|nr:hypothetical protein CB1_001271004 [Camelus ferus]